MGKTTEAEAEPPSAEKETPAVEKQATTEDTDTGKDTSHQETSEPAPTTQKTPPKEKKEDVESLRKVIKLDSTSEEQEETQKEDSSPVDHSEEENQKEDTSSADNKEDHKEEEETKTEDNDLADHVEEKATSNETDPEPSLSREALEQKRAILQSIKDFDFQIKKNQEDIGSINQKLDGLSKDLDDLVSLYEIVSEQMNPFVGLSKVTKKRFDQLGHLMQTLDSLKTRMDELESSSDTTIMQTVNGKTSATTPTTSRENQGFNLSDNVIDRIIELSFGTFTMDDKIDMAIDNFIESLKDENIN
jgi:chromosome segregation ATPase